MSQRHNAVCPNCGSRNSVYSSYYETRVCGSCGLNSAPLEEWVWESEDESPAEPEAGEGDSDEAGR